MNVKNPLVPVEYSTELAETMSAPPMVPEDAAAPLKKVHSVMRGRYGWAALLGITLAMVGAAAGWLGPSLLGQIRYSSQGIIRIEPLLQTVLRRDADNGLLPLFDAYVTSQVAMINSQRVLNQAWKHEAWRSVKPTMTDEDKAQFYKRLRVSHPGGTELIFISFEDPDPAVGPKAVKAIVSAYQELYGERDVKSLTDRMQVLETRRTQLRDQVAGLQQRRRAIGQEFGSDDLSQFYGQKLQLVSKLEAELREVEMMLAAVSQSVGRRTEAQGGQPAGPNQAGAQNQPGAQGPPAAADAGAKSDAKPDAKDSKAKSAPGATAQANAGEKKPPTAPAMTAAAEPAPELNLTVDEIGAVDGQMRAYVQQREQLERNIETNTIYYGPQHREVVRARAVLASVNQAIEEYAAFYRMHLRDANTEFPRQLAQLQQRLLIINSIYERAKSELVEVGTKNLSIAALRQEEFVTEQKLRETNERIDSLNVEQAMAGRVKVISEGEIPLEPVSDKRKLLLAAGGISGFGMGAGIVLLIGLLDRRFRSMHDATDSFSRITMLGILPRLPDDLADPDQATIAARCVHQIRTLLQIGSDSQGRRVFTITSPGPDDGKTSLTLALGLSFAASDAKTLIIDCDLAGGGLTSRVDSIIRRKIGQILQREQIVTEQQIEQALRLAQESNRRLGETLIELGYLSQADLDNALGLQEDMPVGLLDALAGEPLDHCVADTGIDNLSIMPIGAAGLEDVAKLSPGTIRRMLDEARKQFDIVLVDTGSVPGSLEASHMTPESDGVVLVVSKGEQRGEAQKAIDHLQTIGARIAGLVFNRAEGRDLEVLPESSSAPEGVLVRRRRAGKDYETQSKRFGPVARAVVSGGNTPSGNSDKSDAIVGDFEDEG